MHLSVNQNEKKGEAEKGRWCFSYPPTYNKAVNFPNFPKTKLTSKDE